MAFSLEKYSEKFCATHREQMVVRPNGFARGRQQYRQRCSSCEAERSKENDARYGGSTGRSRTHRTKYPLKAIARHAVQNAIRDGKLKKQPCERCGKHDGVHAHHEDYRFPLQVMWLCRKHHAERHMELLRGKAA